MKKFFLGLIIILGAGALSFSLTAGATWVVCKCFGFAFTWKVAIGVWIILWVVQSLINSTRK